MAVALAATIAPSAKPHRRKASGRRENGPGYKPHRRRRDRAGDYPLPDREMPIMALPVQGLCEYARSHRQRGD